MDPPIVPRKYNLYENEEVFLVGNSRYKYYVATIPTNPNDRIILEDLVVEIGQPAIWVYFIVVKEHFTVNYAKVPDDFDVCSPLWSVADTNEAEKFAKKEFGPKWRKTHRIMCTEFRLG